MRWNAEPFIHIIYSMFMSFASLMMEHEITNQILLKIQIITELNNDY